LSVARAAALIGVHATTLTRWEHGHRPYTRQLPMIAAVLRLDKKTVETLAGPAPRRPGRRHSGPVSPLAAARLAAGLNRVDIGRLMHVGPATVYRWECGDVRPPVDRLAALATALRLTRPQLDDALAGHPPSRFDGVILPGLGAALRRHGVGTRHASCILRVSPSTMSYWETGRTRVPMHAVRALADACSVDPEELIRRGRTVVPRARRTPLAALRHSAGMTQREAAAMLGVSVSTLSRYENGSRAVMFPLARKLAHIYAVPFGRMCVAADLAPPQTLTMRTWVPEQLPQVLADLRTAAGASKSQVAQVTGVTSPTVRRWETGESVPGDRILSTLERYYRLPGGRLTALEHGTPARGRMPAADRFKAPRPTAEAS
jgi:transcriptional regulator with XRE-family HTH domain